MHLRSSHMVGVLNQRRLDSVLYFGVWVLIVTSLPGLLFGNQEQGAKTETDESGKASTADVKHNIDQDNSGEESSQDLEQTGTGSGKVELPWERKRENRIPRLTKLNERELLNDVTEEELLSVQDHLPLNQENQHLFAKLLFRVPQFGLDNLNRLANEHADIGLDKLEIESGFHRFKVLRIRGKVRQWEARKLVPEVGELFDLSIYYKVKIQTEDHRNVIVFCRDIPSAWKGSQDLNEDGSLEGLFLNMTLSREKTPIFNFIAERIHWSPRSKSDLVTQTGPALLGSAGFDLGLLDGLQTRNKKRLDKNDTETFYQMLAAAKLVARSRNEPNWQEEVPQFNLIDTLRAPHEYHGAIRVIRVQIRNVTRVQVEEDYIKNRIGIDQYFQLDGFVKFDSSVTYKAEDGKEGAVFKDKYPVSICINDLPEGWSAGSDQRYDATFPVFFFKVWAYPSGYQNKFSDESLQQSPLFIALNPIKFEKVQASVNWMAIGLAAVLGIGLLSIWTTYFIGKAKKEKNATQFRMPSQMDEDNIPELDSKPVAGNKPVPGMPVIKE